ncbi:MAG: cupredoxin domain-containing protein [Nitriliruptorales bacterium]
MRRLDTLLRRRRTLVALLVVGALVAFASLAFAATEDVDVQDNVFVPETVAVTVGDTVRWTQSGGNPHTITADDRSFDSRPDCNSFADAGMGNCMSEGDTFEITFEEEGEVPYFCKIHGAEGGQGMSGVIVVEAADEGKPEQQPEEQPEDQPEEEPEQQPEDQPEEQAQEEPASEPQAEQAQPEEEELPNTGAAAGLAVLGLATLGLMGFGVRALRRGPRGPSAD